MAGYTAPKVSATALTAGAVGFVLLLAGFGSDLVTEEPDSGSGLYGGGATTQVASLSITRVDFGAGTVTIANAGTTDADLDGHWLCNFPTYEPLTGTVPAGETLTVAFEVPAGGGEVGLYSSNSFGDSNAIVSYVEWGEPGHTRSSVAIEAGLWDGLALPGGANVLVSATGDRAAKGGGDWTVE